MKLLELEEDESKGGGGVRGRTDALHEIHDESALIQQTVPFLVRLCCNIVEIFLCRG